jgi:predicted cytidylate kinase
MENNTTKKQAITISGSLGSGKSTTANLLAKKLGYSRFSGGDFMRRMAEERKIPMAEFSLMAETDEAIDKAIDAALGEFMQKNDKYIVDARLGWYWEPKAFKVFLTLPTEIAAERILKDLETNELRQVGEAARNYDEILEKITHRLESEKVRYLKYYGIENNHDESHFDLVINTESMPPDHVVEMISREYEKWLSL